MSVTRIIGVVLIVCGILGVVFSSFSFTKDGETWKAKFEKPKGTAESIKEFDDSKVKDFVRAYKALNADGFAEAVMTIARRFDPVFEEATVERRLSRAGNYLSLTVTITATSREQLDELYRTLSTHPMVKVVL